MSAAPDDHRHYMRLPMCGYCTNAWDMIYMRLRPGTITSAQWLKFCRVGGCDPDVWEFLDEETGWPKGFVVKDNGHVDWERTIEDYEPPEYDNRVFHRRLSEAENAAWRRVMGKITEAFHATRNAKSDENGALKDEHIDWGEVEFEEPEETEPVVVVDDDEIEW